jgi:hypothetical protein
VDLHVWRCPLEINRACACQVDEIDFTCIHLELSEANALDLENRIYPFRHEVGLLHDATSNFTRHLSLRLTGRLLEASGVCAKDRHWRLQLTGDFAQHIFFVDRSLREERTDGLAEL